MNTYLFKSIYIILISIILVTSVYPQSTKSDSSYQPYKVNYWITIPIIGLGIAANLIGIPGVMHKQDISTEEFKALNKDIIHDFDRWALDLDPNQIDDYKRYSNYASWIITVLPTLLLFDKNIRQDWFDILLMYMETTFITSNFFNYSFVGPAFNSKFRPAVYYDQLTYEEKKTGNNRNSFYSGHTASSACVSFFIAKVYSDYNPEIGNNKYLLYAAATVPPLIMGYTRIRELKHFPSDVMVGLAVGAMFGILIPEFHRIQTDNIKLGFYTNNESTGISVLWQPNLLR